MTYRTRALAIPAPGIFGGEAKWVHAIAALAFILASLPQVPLLAQGLDDEEAIETIVGSEVGTEEQKAEAEADRVIAAIANAHDTAQEVRKAFSLDELKIVFLPDLGSTPEIDDAIASNQTTIKALRQAIEGSAMFYHAVDSRSINLSDIVALEFGEDNTATIFVAGEDPNK